MVTKKSVKPKQKGYRSNLQKIRERYEQDGGGGDWFKPRDGKNRIRVMPPWSEEGIFYLKGGLHYGFSIGGRDRALACLKVGGRGNCPVCMVVDTAKAAGDDYKKLVDRIRVKVKYFVNVIDRRNPKTVQMFGMSKKAWKLISSPMADEEDPLDATDPDEGYDMIIEKEGSGMMTRYQERLSPKSTPIDVDGWEDKLHQLDKEVLEWMSYDEMVKHLKTNYGDALAELEIKFKTKAKDEDEDEEEEKPKKKLKKKPVDEDEDDEDDDDDEDED